MRLGDVRTREGDTSVSTSRYPHQGYQYRASAATVVALLGFFVPLAAWVFSGYALPFDLASHQELSQVRSPALIHLAVGAIRVASATVIAGPLTVLLLLVTHQRRRAVGVAASGLGALALNLGLKELFHRTRPGEPDGYLFPSTHMLLTVVVYGLISGSIGMHLRTGPRWMLAVAMAWLTVWVGLSLVYLDQHYLTDVIGALMLGGAWLCASLALINRAAPSARAAYGASG